MRQSWLLAKHKGSATYLVLLIGVFLLVFLVFSVFLGCCEDEKCQARKVFILSKTRRWTSAEPKSVLDHLLLVSLSLLRALFLLLGFLPHSFSLLSLHLF